MCLNQGLPVVAWPEVDPFPEYWNKGVSPPWDESVSKDELICAEISEGL